MGKLDDAEKKGQISGSTLDNLKKSVENLDKIENFVEDTAEGLGISQLAGKEVFGTTEKYADFVGQATLQEIDILSQAANTLKSAKLSLHHNIIAGLIKNEIQ